MTLIRTVKNGSKYGPARIKQVKDIQCRKSCLYDIYTNYSYAI